ncbi:MAG: oxygen-independent coproporphyrinogen III oxidase [Fusobacteria bacterium]|nr:MAG: oxygen-independent coproporphyrinogen III oxidase [Fusobacteriota bacterium]KAF0229981.1 MAG: oxygen-independent coproporphyrinogen III [Fusobacteriota bacterium]
MMNNRTGIYVHIPFCIKKCDYCDFISASNYELEDQYFEKLITEIQYRGNEERETDDGNKVINTIYFGGGTPSSVRLDNIRKVVTALKEKFNLAKLEEMTIEVNPGTCNNDNIQNYYEMGFNRLSIGVQSFDEEMLKRIGRIHNRADIYKTVDIAQKAGFKNISIDLMYGLPNDSLERLEKDLKLAMEMNLQHISTYGLIVEEGTKFYDELNEGRLLLPEEDELLQMRDLINRKLFDQGFKRYEIANYAKAGYESKHNLIYWNNDDYYGFGLNSTTKVDDRRYMNEPDILKYIGSNEFEKYNLEEITEVMKIEEAIFLGLRLIEGIDLVDYFNRYNIDIKEKYKKVIDELIDIKAMWLGDRTLRLTDYGFEISNYCLAKFLS